MKKTGILGGTFDPVHRGHLAIAETAKQSLALDQVRFVPLHIPAHRRAPVASIDQRLIMLELALKDTPDFIIDQRELSRPGVSYTITTLRSLRDQFPHDSLMCLMGQDAFNTINGWEEWQKILDYAHIVCISRSYTGERPSDTFSQWTKKHLTTHSTLLHQHCYGHIYRLNMDPIAISSSKIRQLIAEPSVVKQLLASEVAEYIYTHHLYQS